MGIIQRYSRIHNIDLSKLKGLDLKTAKERLQDNLVEEFDIDKSWEAIHFLITGDKAYFGDHKFSQILSPKDEIFDISEDDHDLYENQIESNDPAIIKKWEEIDLRIENQIGFLEPNQIKELHQIILQSNFQQILEEIDLELLNSNNIYPETWSNTKQSKEYIKEHFNSLKRFIERAIDANDIILVHKPQ